MELFLSGQGEARPEQGASSMRMPGAQGPGPSSAFLCTLADSWIGSAAAGSRTGSHGGGAGIQGND